MSLITAPCSDGSGPVYNLLVLEIHRVGPAESNYILLVTSADVDVGVARGHVVLLADGAVFGEALVDGGIEVLSDAGRVVVKALGVQAGDPDPVGRRPPEGLIPLQASVGVAH